VKIFSILILIDPTQW